MLTELTEDELHMLENKMVRSRHRLIRFDEDCYLNDIWFDVTDVMVEAMKELRRRTGYDYY